MTVGVTIAVPGVTDVLTDGVGVGVAMTELNLNNIPGPLSRNDRTLTNSFGNDNTRS